MNFREVAGQLIAYRDDTGPCLVYGTIVKAQLDGDDQEWAYFTPTGAHMSCRDCRKIAEKLSELNGSNTGNSP